MGVNTAGVKFVRGRVGGRVCTKSSTGPRLCGSPADGTHAVVASKAARRTRVPSSEKHSHDLIARTF